MRSTPVRFDARARRLVDDPDGVLVARARGGDRAAFEELARRHGDRLYAVVRALGLGPDAAREVTQEAFLRAWRGIGAFSGNARFFTWLYRIGVNEAKRRLAREPPAALPVSLDAENAPDPPDLSTEPQVQLVRKELREAMVRAVPALPLKYRAPLILRDVEGLSAADAAAILGLGEAAFKSRLHRARSGCAVKRPERRAPAPWRRRPRPTAPGRRDAMARSVTRGASSLAKATRS